MGQHCRWEGLRQRERLTWRMADAMPSRKANLHLLLWNYSHQSGRGEEEWEGPDEPGEGTGHSTAEGWLC
jgi:hypothetical protein